MDNPLFLVNNGLLLKGSVSGGQGGGQGGGGGQGVFFAERQGGTQAVLPYIWKNALLNNPLTGTQVSGIGIFLAFTSAPVHSQISSNEYKTDLDIPAIDLIQFADSAALGQINPFAGIGEDPEDPEGGIIIDPEAPIGGGGGGGLSLVPEQIFFNAATYLECPNGLQTLNRYEIDNVIMGWTGFQALPVVGLSFPPSTVCVGANYPLQDSLAISATYPDVGFSGTGANSDWGICGTGVLNTGTSNNSNSQPISMLLFRDVRFIFGNPLAGETFTIRYKVEIVNTAGQTETAFHTVVITLT